MNEINLKTVFLTAVLGLGLLAGCTKDDSHPSADLIESVTFYDSAGAATQKEEYTYNGQDKISAAKVTTGLSGTPYVSNYTFTYNGDGQITEILRHAAGTSDSKRTFTYANGNMATRTFAFGTDVQLITQYHYEDSKLISLAAHSLAYGSVDSSVLTYNAANQLVSTHTWQITPDSTIDYVEDYTYDASGRLTTYGRNEFRTTFYYVEPLASDSRLQTSFATLSLIRMIGLNTVMPESLVESLGTGVLFNYITNDGSTPPSNPFTLQQQGSSSTYKATQTLNHWSMDIKVNRR